MTSWVVVDSGILLAIVIPENATPVAKVLWQHLIAQSMRVAAPSLIRYEMVAVVRKHVNRGTIGTVAGEAGLKWLLAQPVQTFMTNELLERAYELATQFNRPTAYDSQYLAVAESLGCDFWTQDERLFNAVTPTLAWVKWIGNFTIPPSA